VSEGFAACVNLLPGAESVYRWEGNIEVAPEIVGLVKTTGSQLEELERLYLQLHPYEVPEFLTIGTAGGNAAYLDWITRSCSGKEPSLSVKRTGVRVKNEPLRSKRRGLRTKARPLGGGH
jgi:periplasmic divalent cation tolerance protein